MHARENIDLLPPAHAWSRDHIHLDWGLNLQPSSHGTKGSCVSFQSSTTPTTIALNNQLLTDWLVDGHGRQTHASPVNLLAHPATLFVALLPHLRTPYWKAKVLP